jgi:calcineurin-like phosphoesterase family protein
MPIHLPPISRRKFLTRSIAAGAGLMLSPNLFAARKPDEHCWALFSDIHLSADPTKIARGVNMTDNFNAVVKEVLALRTQPANVLVCGDLAFNNGESLDYEHVLDLLAPLRKSGKPVHLAMGNHDNRERFWDSFLNDKTVKRPLEDRVTSIIQSPRANWFVLDSLDKTRSTPGILGDEQRAWLAKSLDENADKPALVVLHHNPGTEHKVTGLIDTKEFLEIIRPRKHVKAFIYGHSHHWNYALDESGIHFVNLPTTAYLFDKESPSGWVLANLEKDGMRMKLSCLDKKHKEHGRVLNLKWRA